MELTNEIKAKVFAQYLGQDCRFPYFRKDYKTELRIGKFVSICRNGITYDIVALLNGHYYNNSINDCKLLLTPLSKISDEDAIEAAKMVFEEDFVEKDDVPFIKSDMGLQGVINDYMTYQLLQSKGYDLPSFYLGGKTLIESGIAIDKTLI